MAKPKSTSPKTTPRAERKPAKPTERDIQFLLLVIRSYNKIPDYQAIADELGIGRQVATNRFNLLRKKYPLQTLAETAQRAKDTANPSKSPETARGEGEADGHKESSV